MGGRRKFSREFKVEAVQMIREGGYGVLEVAKDLGVRPDVLRRWKRQVETAGLGAFPGSGRLQPEDEEMRRLRRELQRVREERDILKKALAIFSERQR
jgi:transposase